MTFAGSERGLHCGDQQTMSGRMMVVFWCLLNGNEADGGDGGRERIERVTECDIHYTTLHY